MNNHKKCLARDELTVSTITEWGVMSTDQICLLLFPSYAVCLRRLLKLTEKKRIKRYEQVMPYCYYIDDKRPDIIRRVNDNWVRLWIIKNLKSWEQLIGYDYKTYAVKNIATGSIKEFCLFDLKIPSVEKIQEELKCASR